MRPTYETPEHRAAQRELAEAYLLSLGEGWSVDESAEHSRFDYLLYDRGHLHALLELKNRDHAYGTKGDVILSDQKYRALLRLSAALRLWGREITPAPIFVVGWNCGCAGRANLGNVDVLTPTHNGRTVQKRDEGDCEPCVQVPLNWFYRFRRCERHGS